MSYLIAYGYGCTKCSFVIQGSGVRIQLQGKNFQFVILGCRSLQLE